VSQVVFGKKGDKKKGKDGGMNQTERLEDRGKKTGK